jgi:hypothetical protein
MNITNSGVFKSKERSARAGENIAAEPTIKWRGDSPPADVCHELSEMHKMQTLDLVEYHL